MSKSTAPIEKALYTLDEAKIALGGIGLDRIYSWIRDGKIEAVRDGGRTFITARSINTIGDRLAPWAEAGQDDARG